MDAYIRRKVTGPPLKTSEEMAYEIARLTTYKNWPIQSGLSSIRLAKAGLYYTGEGDQVTCFSCSGQLHTWKAGDSPKMKHKRFFPCCAFVNGRDSKNVPLANTAETPSMSVFEDVSPSSESMRNARDAPNGARDFSSRRRNKPSFYRNRVTAAVVDNLDGSTSLACLTHEIDQHHPRGQCGSLPSSSAGYRPARAYRIPRLSDGTPILTDRIFTYQDQQDLKRESKRLASYTDWPDVAANIPKDFLSAAGFYYLGLADRVKCAFCSGILRNWKSGDEPMVDHQKFFPNCDFIRDSRAAGNVTIDDENADPLRMSQGSQNGVMTERPKHQRYAVEVTRLSTYRGWRRHTRPFPDDLAAAGFFYTGTRDQVKCFYCDGTLRHWETRDDAWEEHARWYPHCHYVKTVKGDEFLLRMQAANPRRNNTTSSAGDTAGVRSQGDNPGTRRFPVEPRAVRARMDTSRVQAVLAMGFPRDLLYNVIQNHLATTGNDFPNVGCLLDAVLTERESPLSSSSYGQQHNNSVATGEATFGNIATPGATTTSGTTSSNAENTASADIAANEHTSSKDTTQSTTDEMRLRCKICLDDEANILFLPCGHLCSCARCAPALGNCAICRSVVKGTVRVYMT